MSICTLKPLYFDCFLLPFFGHHTGGLTEQNLGLKVKPAIGQGRVGDSADDLPCRHFSHISGVNIHRGKGRGDQGETGLLSNPVTITSEGTEIFNSFKHKISCIASASLAQTNSSGNGSMVFRRLMSHCLSKYLGSSSDMMQEDLFSKISQSRSAEQKPSQRS